MNIEDRVMSFQNEVNGAIAELLRAGFNEDWSPIVMLRHAARVAGDGPSDRASCVCNVADAFATIEERRKRKGRTARKSIVDATEVMHLRVVSNHLRRALVNFTA